MNEIEQRVIELYHQGMNTVQIGEIVGRHNGTVGRILRKHGLKARGNKVYVPKEYIQEMVEKYNNGATTIELAKEYKIGDRTVATILRKEGVKIRRAVRRTKLKNHNYFSVIDTPEKAYFLGFMLTDGSIIEDKRGNRAPSVSIMLKAEDAYILEELDKQLGSDGSSVKISNRNEAYLRYGSQELAEGLAQYGVVPNKTFTTELPRLPDELMPHLIRGIFDGDGTVHFRKYKSGKGIKRRLCFGFYGTYRLCEQILEYLHEKIGLPINKITDKGTVSFVVFQRVQDIINFYHYIYDNATVYLVRKKEKFEEFLQDVDSEVTGDTTQHRRA